VNVRPTPWAESERVRDGPAAPVALGSGEVAQIAPPMGAPALRAESHVALHPVATDTAVLAGPGPGAPAPTRAHTDRQLRPQCAG